MAHHRRTLQSQKSNIGPPFKQPAHDASEEIDDSNTLASAPMSNGLNDSDVDIQKSSSLPPLIPTTRSTTWTNESAMPLVFPS
ncbi:hypothetical protein M407DRAFT_28278 [Tulasnella calospora MUT 4182]|uniref:Uncharacterized protein n=1 Tax=Tulasnella calospora MUT 4182 TaxID=1051891 RepID=A0A0C3QB12_9AGAM|nr:hypothetical protein M407DRAFT_28278 [Tulasnella calospora MUT 4182]